MWVELNVQAGDFELIRRHDWDCDSDSDDLDARRVDIEVQSGDMEQSIHLVFAGVGNLRTFVQRITELAAWDFTHGREVLMSREGAVIHDQQFYRGDDDDS